MVASVSSSADLANVGLTRIGYKLRVGSLYDGSLAAKNLLDIYAQTRDELLTDGNWEFAERNANGQLLKSAPPGGYVPPNGWTPAYPAVPWLFSYAFPSDALKIRVVKPVPVFVPDFDPQPHAYSIDNDNAFVPPQRVILSNVANAVIVYTGQVTDPATWDVLFVEAFAAALGRRVAPMLVGLDVAKFAASDENVQTTIAEGTQE